MNQRNLIKLYSSVNLPTSSDTKTLTPWNLDNKIKMLIQFISKYETEFFRATVELEVYNDRGAIRKTNIAIRDICFKNELNVSISSQTDEYKYLYEVSCDTADNIYSSVEDLNVDVGDDSSLSITSLKNRSIERDISTNIKKFIESDAFLVKWNSKKPTITLDTTLYTTIPTPTLNFAKESSNVVFPSVKNTIKYKYVKGQYCSSSHSYTSSLCTETTTTTSSTSKCKKNNIFKNIMIGAVVLLLIMAIFSIFRKKDNNNNLSQTQLPPSKSMSFSNIFTNVNGFFNPESKPENTNEMKIVEVVKELVQ